MSSPARHTAGPVQSCQATSGGPSWLAATRRRCLRAARAVAVTGQELDVALRHKQAAGEVIGHLLAFVVRTDPGVRWMQAVLGGVVDDVKQLVCLAEALPYERLSGVRGDDPSAVVPLPQARGWQVDLLRHLDARQRGDDIVVKLRLSDAEE